MSALPAPLPRDECRATDLWEQHFREPAAALDAVHRVLALPSAHDERTLAWAELTQGFHCLFFTGGPAQAGGWLARAGERFLAIGDRRGALLVDAGRARMLIYEGHALTARDMLGKLLPEARRMLAPTDQFWVLNTLSATYYYTDDLDEAIRLMYETLELLRRVELSPQLVTVLSNLSAALVTVGDYVPARELAQEALALLEHFDNPQVRLYARSNLAEALAGTGDREGALATVDAMLAEGDPAFLSPQNHSCAIAAQVYADHGRVADARNCAALETAAEAAARRRHLPIMCKAFAALSQRYAAEQRYAAAWEAQRRLGEASEQRLLNRASARYYLLRIEHELASVREERDREHTLRHESEALAAQLTELNAELSRRMREVEELRSQLALEAVHDPLTGLFNRRYLDSAMPGLVGAAERHDTPLTIALIDLDHFKKVNDRHGHLAGDKVLRRIGKLLGTALRPADIVARWGGEEFCVVFPATDLAGAGTALATLAAKLRELQVEWAGHTIGGFTFSAALAAFGPHGRTLAELVGAADGALYAAKGAGRDRVLVAQSPA